MDTRRCSTDLFTAIRKTNLERLERLLKTPGCSPDICDDKGTPALVYCMTLVQSQSGSQAAVKTDARQFPEHTGCEILSLLLRYGAEIHLADSRGWNATMWAAAKDLLICLKLLIEHGADLTVANRYGDNPILIAIKGDCHNCVAHLVCQKKHHLDQLNKLNQTPLLLALRRDNIRLMKLLLMAGANVDVRDKYGATPLMLALEKKDNEAIQLLLENGANVNAVDYYEKTPLMVAARGGEIPYVEVLLRAGADLEVRDCEGYTALMYASNAIHNGVLKLLLGYDACVNAVADDGKTALILCAVAGDVPCMKSLLKSGARTEEKDCNGYNALMHTLVNFRFKAFRLLLEYKADVNVESISGVTPLMVALEQESKDEVKLLLSHGASVNSQTREGMTPLMIAAKHGDVSSLKLILHTGVDDKEVGDSDGYTALMYSLINGRYNKRKEETMNFLIKCGVNFTVVSKHGETPLIMAAKYGNTRCLGRLLNLPYDDINAKDARGYTALVYLLGQQPFDNNIEKFVNKLLEKGSCVNIVTNDGHTPLSLMFHQAVDKNKTSSQSDQFDQENDNLFSKSKEAKRYLLIIHRFLDLGADLSLSREDQKYLNKMVSTRNNDIVQKMVENGCPPRCFAIKIKEGSHFEPKSQSPLQAAILSNNIDAARYFLANRFLTYRDSVPSSTNQLFKDIVYGLASSKQKLRKKEKKLEEVNQIVTLLTQSPFSLYTLSFICVSSVLESEVPQSIPDKELNVPETNTLPAIDHCSLDQPAQSHTNENHLSGPGFLARLCCPFLFFFRPSSYSPFSLTPKSNLPTVVQYRRRIVRKDSASSIDTQELNDDISVSDNQNFRNSRDPTGGLNPNDIVLIPTRQGSIDDSQYQNKTVMNEELSNSTDTTSGASFIGTEAERGNLESLEKLTRKERVNRLPLPDYIKAALLFQTPSVSTDPKSWCKIEIRKL